MSRNHYPSNYQAWPNQQPQSAQWQYQQQQQQQQPEYLQQQFIYQTQQQPRIHSQQQNYYQQPQAQYGYMEYSPSPYSRSYETNPFVSPQSSMSTPLSQNSYHMTQQLPQVNQYAQPQISQQPIQQQLYQHQLQQQFTQQQLIQQPQQPVPQQLTLSEHLAPTRQLSQPIVPTQALPQAPTQINVYQQTSSSQFSQKPLQEPQLLPHQLLWYLAEHYLTKASALPTSSLVDFPTLTPQHQRHILAAINCLEAVLKSITNGKNYMPLIELKTRFRLSQILFWFTDNIREAENHIQKAILLARELDKVTELKFRMIDFQCNILKSAKNFKAAKNLMKSCIVEAIENNIPNWTYHFLLQCAELHYLEGDFNGCSKILKQAESMADQKGDVEMKACLLISMAQYAFSSQNYPEAQHALAELSTVYFPPPSSRPPPTYHIFPISNQLLYLHFSLLFITYHMHTGNMKAATEKLTEVHQILDQKQDEVTLDELKGYTTIHISAASTTAAYTNATTASQSLPVTIRWLSKAEIYTLTFLISGICNRGDTSTIKSIIFLTEGLKIVEREIYSNDDNQFPIHDVIKSKKFYVTLKAYMLQHLVDSYLMRSDFDDAEKTIAQLINWITEYNLWSQFHVSVTLALGMINQCVGKFYEAIEYYKQVEKITDNREIRILSKINHALIMVGSGNNHHQDIGTIIKEIKQELVYQTHNIDSLRAALHFLEALSYGDFTRTKEHLAETLKLSTTLFNNQLKSLTLSVLGEIFCAEHNEQAEKMLSAAYQLSKDANNDLGCLVSGRLLKDIYRFQHNQLNYSKRVAFNEQHELTVQKTLTNWSEKRRVVLDLIENGSSKSSSTPIIQHNASGENSMGSSNTNMMHSVPGGGGYV